MLSRACPASDQMCSQPVMYRVCVVCVLCMCVWCVMHGGGDGGGGGGGVHSCARVTARTIGVTTVRLYA